MPPPPAKKTKEVTGDQGDDCLKQYTIPARKISGLDDDLLLRLSKERVYKRTGLNEHEVSQKVW